MEKAVFKVVQLYRDRYFSSNASLNSLQKHLTHPNKFICEYKINSPTFPTVSSSLLFAFLTIEEAKDYQLMLNNVFRNRFVLFKCLPIGEERTLDFVPMDRKDYAPFWDKVTKITLLKGAPGNFYLFSGLLPINNVGL